MSIKGLLILSATSLLAGSALAAPQILNLQQLQAKCHEMESNDQYLPFTSQFTCSEERTFWVKKGSKPLPLANGSQVKIKALIKGNQHQTDWWTIPGKSEDQATSCDMFEQVRGIARSTRTIKSCAELDVIGSEQEYCKGLLLPVWDDCARDMSSGNIREGHLGACEYIPTGVVRGCKVEPGTSTTSTTSTTSVPDTTTSTTKVKAPSVPEESTTSSTSAAGVAIAQPLPETAHLASLGASVKAVKVKGGMFSQHHMVQLESNPEANSMLAKLNLQSGDIIAKVNGKKVHSQEELLRELRAARSKNSAVTIKFKDARGMFLDRTRASI